MIYGTSHFACCISVWFFLLVELDDNILTILSFTGMLILPYGMIPMSNCLKFNECEVEILLQVLCILGIANGMCRTLWELGWVNFHWYNQIYLYLKLNGCEGKVKVKQSHYRPGWPWGFQEVEVPRFKRQLAQEGGKVFSPMRCLPLPSRKYFWYLFLLEAESTPGPPSGIEPATFWLVV
jgi:hypothetical protein